MYKTGKIYKVVNKQKDILYIGSTTHSINTRRNNHVSKYNCGTNMLFYRSLKELNKTIHDCDFELLECCSCSTKLDLLKKERYYIEKLLPKYNQNIPSRTAKEWEKDNRDKRRIYQRKWERANNIRRNEYRRNRRKLKKLNNIVE